MDITLCVTDKCPLRQECHRWQSDTVKNYSKYNSYFVDPPFKINKGKFECDMYWGDSSKYLFEQLTSIVNGRDNPKSRNPRK